MAQPPSEEELNAMTPVEPAATTPSAAAQASEAGSLFTIGEMQLTLLIFLFGLLSLALFYLLIRTGHATPFLMRMYVIIILVFGTLLVVSSAYATEQIAPVVGFFGTIAGYLLGKTERSSDPPGS